MPIAAGLIFLATLVCVLVRPFGRGEAWWTSAGALLVLGIGAVSPAAAWRALAAQGNVFLFLFGLMSIAGLADAAGFFDLAGAAAVALARGSGRALLLCVFGVGALVTAFLSNDATALILTPVVYGLVTRLRLRPLPYLLAATFVADTASVQLPVSNPINVLVGGRLQLTLGSYLGHFLPGRGGGHRRQRVALPGRLLATGGPRFRARLADPAGPGPPRSPAPDTDRGRPGRDRGRLPGRERDPRARGGGCNRRRSAPAPARARLPPARALPGARACSLEVLVYVAGLFVLVAALEQAGLTGDLAHWLRDLVRPGPPAVVAGALAAAVGSNGINNVPAATVLLSASAD